MLRLAADECSEELKVSTSRHAGLLILSPTITIEPNTGTKTRTRPFLGPSVSMTSSSKGSGPGPGTDRAMQGPRDSQSSLSNLIHAVASSSWNRADLIRSSHSAGDGDTPSQRQSSLIGGIDDKIGRDGT
ncbi:hypothetical protein BO70DRAFT_103359 [Aspergillus heteromorphus CBS 117.55]|uniref:Uncharacterized protein n=1 Tax=Aspergillus heteromorphus CBS 117.55 TaxID=1448321 RepID=A0A317VTB2_9EURO|nr:uncharacterized protein BO70DRAFT_103359 [Aspergillus heteromorphus CBS 117.55]PWY75170.1 hypothetical protein BO70DRAFT_103359 [Aspergillus heteromorphus CBS 117.55]